MSNYFSPNQQARLSYLEQYQNPFISQIQPNQPQKQNNVNYALINGLEEAKTFPVAPGRVGLLFDNQQNEFYMKTVDGMGMQSLKKFEYKEVPLPASSAPGIAGDRAELDALNKRMSNIESMLQDVVNQNNQQKKEKAPEVKK